MTPIGKYIVLTPVSEDVKTDSGIFLSGDDVGQLRYKRGIVFESGTDVSVIAKGDDIYYDKGQSFTMLIDGCQYSIIQERDVVVVL